MAIESADYISQLDFTYPAGGDQRTTSDDHHRLTKKAIKQSFPNINSEVSASSGEMNKLVGLTQNVQATLDDISAGYRSAIAVTSANLDAKIDAVSAQLSTTSAALDAKIEALSSNLDTKIETEIANRQTTSANLDAKIEALSATLDNQIVAASSALDTKIEALSATLNTAKRDKVSGCRATLTATQLFTGVGATNIDFDTDNYDTDSIHSNPPNEHLFVVPGSGPRVICMTANVLANTSATDNTGLAITASITDNNSQGGTASGVLAHAVVQQMLTFTSSNFYAGQLTTGELTATAGRSFRVRLYAGLGALAVTRILAGSWFQMKVIK